MRNCLGKPLLSRDFVSHVPPRSAHSNYSNSFWDRSEIGLENSWLLTRRCVKKNGESCDLVPISRLSSGSSMTRLQKGLRLVENLHIHQPLQAPRLPGSGFEDILDGP